MGDHGGLAIVITQLDNLCRYCPLDIGIDIFHNPDIKLNIVQQCTCRVIFQTIVRQP